MRVLIVGRHSGWWICNNRLFVLGYDVRGNALESHFVKSKPGLIKLPAFEMCYKCLTGRGTKIQRDQREGDDQACRNSVEKSIIARYDRNSIYVESTQLKVKLSIVSIISTGNGGVVG